MTSDDRDDAHPHDPVTGVPPHQPYPPEPDPVDETSEESVPASDPPSGWAGPPEVLGGGSGRAPTGHRASVGEPRGEPG